METKRQLKISRLLLRDLSEIITQEVPGLAVGAMITVTKVNVAPDLSFAKVYLSIFGKDDKASVVEKVNLRSREIRGLLGQRVRHQLRVVPQLRFYEDDSLDYIDNLDNLLNED
ncbi:MAG: 30S ribosome-binding factor RbfA [Bacteroidetes bacterium]|jgi:ribosome-binding factor A|nr:30S ribosome-binding factor RbfA [Bacteroidota bacterium]